MNPATSPTAHGSRATSSSYAQIPHPRNLIQLSEALLKVIAIAALVFAVILGSKKCLLISAICLMLVVIIYACSHLPVNKIVEKMRSLWAKRKTSTKITPARVIIINMREGSPTAQTPSPIRPHETLGEEIALFASPNSQASPPVPLGNDSSSSEFPSGPFSSHPPLDNSGSSNSSGSS